MAETLRHLEAVLPSQLARLVHEFLLCKPGQKIAGIKAARAGHGELCMATMYKNDALRGACEGGHIELIVQLLEREPPSEYMLSRGMWGACDGKQLDAAIMILDRLAHDGGLAEHIHEYLSRACEMGAKQIVTELIARGARRCEYEQCEGHQYPPLQIAPPDPAKPVKRADRNKTRRAARRPRKTRQQHR